jgi:hypothetical protein
MDRLSSSAEFGKQMAARIGLFAAFLIFFPLIVDSIVFLAGGQHTGRTNVRLAVTIGVGLKLIAFLVFLGVLISPCWKRMRSLGLAAGWSLVVPFLFLLDSAFFLVVTAYWTVKGFPFFAFTSLMIVAAMWLASPRVADRSRQMLFTQMTIGLLLLALMVAGCLDFAIYGRVAADIASMRPAEEMSVQMKSIADFWQVLGYLKLAICLTIGGLLVWFLRLSRAGTGHDDAGTLRIAAGGPAR